MQNCGAYDLHKFYKQQSTTITDLVESKLEHSLVVYAGGSHPTKAAHHRTRILNVILSLTGSR